jgi:SecD/SecF fusion protein
MLTQVTGRRAVLVYRARRGDQAVTTGSIAATVAIMRERAKGLGVPSTDLATGGDQITLTIAVSSNFSNTDSLSGKVRYPEPAASKTGQLRFYDWEPNVVGPTGKPAPTDATVTGGAEAGSSAYGLSEYQAVLRAAKRLPELRDNDTTWTSGCSPQQINECLFGSWYLIDTKNEKMLCPGESAICRPAGTESSLYTDGYKPPAGTRPKALRVNPGTVLVQARPTETARGRIINHSPDSFYVIKDNPVLSGADLTHPQQGYAEVGGGNGLLPKVSGIAAVRFGFTSHGASVFEQVTKEIAHRGQEAQLPGVAKEAAIQHFAVALDGQLITTPSIDFTEYPEGIDASNGSEISGGLTIAALRELADELRTGELPLRLVLVSRTIEG